VAGRFFIESEGCEMNDLTAMGGGSAQDDWPELEPDRRNDRADDPDADPNVTDDEENRPGVPASDPESGA
jgi:hypothetical protein